MTLPGVIVITIWIHGPSNVGTFPQRNRRQPSHSLRPSELGRNSKRCKIGEERIGELGGAIRPDQILLKRNPGWHDSASPVGATGVYNAVCLGAQIASGIQRAAVASFIKRSSALLPRFPRRTVRARDYSFVPPGRRTTFRERGGARAVPFGTVLNVNRLGAFGLLVIVAQTTGMRLFAFLTRIP